MRKNVKEIFEPCDLLEDTYPGKERFSAEVWDKIVNRARNGEAEALRFLIEYGYLRVRRHDSLVLVPERVAEDLDCIRQSGQSKMMDYQAVMEMAEKNGFRETVLWMKANEEAYYRGVLKGFDLELEPEG